jgi:TolB-like protein
MPVLLQRLKDRKIVQWSIAYLAGSWVLIEATSVLAEPFGLAVDPITRALTVFLAWGFLGALVIAWFHAEKGRQSVTVLELALLALIGAGGVSTAVVSYRMGDLGTPVASASGRLESVLQGPVVAVLPFVNASEAAEGAAFLASGIHGEVLTHLSKLSGINAISRTSVASYQAADRSLRQIAEELGATAILEGTVQRAGSLIRINVSLIDAVRDVQLWGEIYEKVLEPESVFAVQAEIATRIAEALAVTLAPAEQSRLTRVPTTDPQAFELYLIGQEAEPSPASSRDSTVSREARSELRSRSSACAPRPSGPSSSTPSWPTPTWCSATTTWGTCTTRSAPRRASCEHAASIPTTSWP